MSKQERIQSLHCSTLRQADETTSHSTKPPKYNSQVAGYQGERLEVNSMTETTDFSKRHIRSFVLRRGRVTPAQQRACDTLLPRFGIPYDAQPLDFVCAFGRVAPRILEIGFGMGEST